MKQIKKATLLLIPVMILTLLTACGGELISWINSPFNTPEVISAPAPETTPVPAPRPTPNNDTQAPENTPEITQPPESTQDEKGGIFPFAFTAVDIYGNTITEESFGKKELFFVHYWGTWCPPCIDEMPDLAQLEKDFDDRVGFLMLLDDMENKDAAINIYTNSAFYNSPYSFTVCGETTFAYDHEIFQMLDLMYVPTTVIIDSEGNMLEHLVGAHYSTYALYLNHHLD